MAKAARTDAITHVGGPTVILDYAGLRLVTDPTFDPAGTRHRIGKLPLTKLAGPAIAAAKVGKVDAVLLSHDTHADNFDSAGRELAAKAGVVITTKAATGRLPGAIGLRRWHTTTLTGVGGVTVTIMATPARHAAFGPHLLAGPVTGFLVTAPKRSAVYITGDNVSRRAAARVATRAVIDVAVLHAGAPKFRSSGPIRYCMTAKQAARAAQVLRARRLIVVHAEGWGHFSETEADVDAAFSTPALQAARIVAPMGKRVEI
jgi:L-ascorbate metabolism protein UlaG (beta-lactamase superfamily)